MSASRIASWATWSTWATRIVLAGMVLAYALVAGTMALRRHANLQSQALDMGYADQVTWNMTQGRLFRFTVFRGRVGDEAGSPLVLGPDGDRDSLLAFHAEFLYLPLAGLYLVFPGPEALIVLLTGVLALGAVPAYLLARRLLGHRLAGLAFAAAYLLAPSVQAANLADFHLVSMAPAPLLFALHFMLIRRYTLFAGAAVAAALMKEEVGLLVAMMGLYLWLVRGERRVGTTVALGALAWVAFCVLIVIPHYSGGAHSLFAARYEPALRHVLGVPAAWLAGRLAWPVPTFTVAYLRGMLAGTGFLALLSPWGLALAAPALAINGLSGFVWQHSGGAHYSAEAVPGILFAAIGGVQRLSRLGWHRRKLAPSATALGLSLVVLGAACWQAREHGILPPARRFALPAPNGRLEALQPLLARIPPDAPLSAQSNLFPHVSRRERVYVFPAIEDARYVLLDVAGVSDPLGPEALAREVSTLVSDDRFRLADAAAGFLLFERADTRQVEVASAASVPDAFYSFVRPTEDERSAREYARFEDLFAVVGYDAQPLPEVNFASRRAVPTVYVRALQQPERDYRLTTFVVEPHGRVIPQGGDSPAQLWYPTSRWVRGEVVKLSYLPVTYSDGDRLGIGVETGDDGNVARLSATSTHVPITDGQRVAVLDPLP